MLALIAGLEFENIRKVSQIIGICHGYARSVDILTLKVVHANIAILPYKKTNVSMSEYFSMSDSDRYEWITSLITTTQKTNPLRIRLLNVLRVGLLRFKK